MQEQSWKSFQIGPDEGPWESGDVTVSAMRCRHPANTYGYRIDTKGLSVAYMPDNELIGAEYPVESDWYDKLVEFLGGVDLLFHDAMFTDSEYPAREGWGHSTFTQAVDLAQRAGVRSLRFFPHAPARSDAELLDILTDMSERSSAKGTRTSRSWLMRRNMRRPSTARSARRWARSDGSRATSAATR